MKKTTRLLAIILANTVFISCTEKKDKGANYASKKIMTVTEAAAFVRASKENEGKEIMITAQSCGVLFSGSNNASLSLTDETSENGLQQPNSDKFYASFNEDAVEYAKAVPNNATVTVSGKIRYVNGKIKLEDCKLIAQN